MKEQSGQLQFPELIDISTLAGLLGVSVRYVRRLVAERQIEVVKVGHYVRFDLDVVRAWVEERRRPGVQLSGPRAGERQSYVSRKL